jgi:hypothetical protein
MLKAKVNPFTLKEAPAKSKEMRPRETFSPLVDRTPVLTIEYLKNEAEEKEELKVSVVRGRLARQAGLERAAEQSEAEVS